MSRSARFLPLALVALVLVAAALSLLRFSPAASAQSAGAAQSTVTLLDERSDITLLMPEASRPRQRTGQLSPALVAAVTGAGRPVAKSITLNLFPNVVSNAVYERTENVLDARVWVGKLEGDPLSLVTLSVANGVLAGNVVSPEGLYEINANAAGVATVAEIDDSRLPQEAEPLTPRLPRGVTPAATAEADPPIGKAATAVTLAAFWTPRAQTEAGGASAIKTKIARAIASFNAANINSGVNVTIRLVYSGPVTYTQTMNYLTDLVRFKTVGDGHMDPVHTTRNTVKADVMSLIVGGSPYTYRVCGVGYLLQPVSRIVSWWSQWAFNMTVLQCLTNATLEHEVGHNMGAHHDSYVTGSEHGAYPYAHGYVDLVGRFRTIMAYTNRCSAAGKICTRIPFFSAPAKRYNGRPVGTTSANNATALNNTAPFMASLK